MTTITATNCTPDQALLNAIILTDPMLAAWVSVHLARTGVVAHHCADVLPSDDSNE